jgi:hypothetical protein
MTAIINKLATKDSASTANETNWKLILAFYLGLAIVTGAVSFFCRPIKLQQATELQKQIWTSFTKYGEAGKTDDLSFKCSSTRILMPAIMRGVVAVTGLKWDYAFSLVSRHESRLRHER